MTFKVGDKSVHPHHGVGEVQAIETKEIAGHRQRFYILKIVGTDTKVMVATEAAGRLGLRKVVSRKEAKAVLEELRADEPVVTAQPWNRRFREYQEMLNSGSLRKIAQVLADLSLVARGKEPSFGERSLMEKAKALLVTELAIARQCKESRVAGEIDAILTA